MKSTTLFRSAFSASGVTEMSTWFAASTGTLVSCETRTGSSLTPSRLAHSLERSQAGPDQCSPLPVVFSTSQGALARTATRNVPDFLIASMRALLPAAGTSWAHAPGTGEKTIEKDSARSTLARPFALVIFASPVSCILVDKFGEGNDFRKGPRPRTAAAAAKAAIRL